MALSRSFYTAVPLQCCVLETGRECTQLVIGLDVRVVHTTVCLADTLPDMMGRTCVCVFACTTDGHCWLLHVPVKSVNDERFTEIHKKCSLSSCSAWGKYD